MTDRKAIKISPEIEICLNDILKISVQKLLQIDAPAAASRFLTRLLLGKNETGYIPPLDVKIDPKLPKEERAELKAYRDAIFYVQTKIIIPLRGHKADGIETEARNILKQFTEYTLLKNADAQATKIEPLVRSGKMVVTQSRPRGMNHSSTFTVRGVNDVAGFLEIINPLPQNNIDVVPVPGKGLVIKDVPVDEACYRHLSNFAGLGHSVDKHK